MKRSLESRLNGLYSRFVLAHRCSAMYTRLIRLMLGDTKKAPDGESCGSASSKLASSDTPVPLWDYTNPWITALGKKKPGADGYAMSGLIPEQGSRTELMAALLAVYDPMPQPGELYVIHAEFINIETGERFIEFTFIETLSLDYASQLISFKKNTRDTTDQLIKFSFNSWDSVNHHYIGSAT